MVAAADADRTSTSSELSSLVYHSGGAVGKLILLVSTFVEDRCTISYFVALPTTQTKSLMFAQFFANSHPPRDSLCLDLNYPLTLQM